MGTIAVFRDPTNLQDVQRYEHIGPYIEFLQAHWPDGFEGGHVSTLNWMKLEVVEYDTPLTESDLVTISLFPGDATTWIMVGMAVIAALSVAVMYMNMPVVTTPTSPAYTTPGMPSADSVYTFSGSANTARIGQVIPVAYGRNLISPDLAMAPYSYFEGNNQYLVHLECLGQGTSIIHDMKIAGSEVNSLGSDVISCLAYPPSAHQQQFGIIQNSTGRYENVYTSPSVSDQELYAGKGGAFNTTANLGTWFWNKWTYPWFDLSTPAPEYAAAIVAGRPVWMIVHDGVNEGSWRVGFMFHAGSTRLKAEVMRYTRGHLLLTGPWWRGGGPANITLTYLDPAISTEPEGGGEIGPFRATPVGVETSDLQYDLVWPNGCYSVASSGGIASWNVSVTFTVEPIDDNDNVIGTGQQYSYSETFASNTPQRRTIYHTIPRGQYRVSARRTSTLSDRASDQSICHWTGLKSILGNTAGGPVYGDVTLISVKIKATEGLASNAHQSLTVDCTRTKDGSDLLTPTAAFADILTNQNYGARRPLSELDTATLAAYASAWSGKTFDAVFDQQTTVWDALKLSLQMQSAIPMTTGSLVSLVADQQRSCANAALTEAQIKSVVLSYHFAEIADFDGVEGEYKNPDDNAAEYITEPFDAVNPDRITLWGCKDTATATAYVKRYWKQMQYRRRTLTIELEGEGNVLQVGDTVDITYAPLELNALRCVVNSCRASDEFSTTLEATVYQPEVFA